MRHVFHKVVGVSFVLVGTIGLGLSAWAWEPDLHHPQFLTDEAVLFAQGPDHAPVMVRTGDIALRMGEDLQIAVGTYPVPKSFVENVRSPYGANWSLYQEVFSTLKISSVNKSELSLAKWIERSFDFDAEFELGNPRIHQKKIPKAARLTHKWMKQHRGAFKSMRFDEVDDGSPEAEAHQKIKGFKTNYYKLNGLDADGLEGKMHYYPGTPFVTHAGIIAVEREGGKNRIYVYDAVPGVSSPTPEDDRYPTGFRKLSPAEFFGTTEARYGVIVRPTQATAPETVKVLEWIWEKYRDAQHMPAQTDLFDYTFDWRQNKQFACSAFVWHGYAEGAGLNIVSDLNFTVVPAWVIRAKSDYPVKMNLQIAPQTLLTSLLTTRVTDFESAAFDDALDAISEGKDPLPLPPSTQRNPETGHLIYSSGPESEMPGAKLH